jgi:hypothetical protein
MSFFYLFFSESQNKCANVSILCQDIESDYDVALKLHENFPKQILFLRYENLSLDPYGTLDILYSFLNLPPKPIMEFYLAEKMGFFRNGTEATNFNLKTVSMSDPKLTEKKLTKPETNWINWLDYESIKSKKL